MSTTRSLAIRSDSVRSPDRLTSLLLTALLFVFFYTFITATAFLPFPEPWQSNRVIGWTGFLFSLVPAIFLQLLLVRYLAAWQGFFGERLIVLAVSIAVWYLLLSMAGSTRGLPAQLLDLLLSPWVNLSLLVWTVLLGALIAYVIRDAATLLPVLLVAALVDFWGVYFGTTRQFVERAPEFVEKVSARLPTLTLGNIPSIPTVGPGDLVFLGFFFAVLYKFNLNVTRTFWFVALLLIVALLAISVVPGFNLFPGLVAIALGVLLANLGAFRLSRAELFATIYVVGALALLLLALVIWGPFQPVSP